MNYETILKEALNSKATPFEVSSWIEEQFPELRESEDERIRKWLLDFVQGLPDEGLDFHFYNLNKEQVVAWLENVPVTIDHEKREGFHLGYKACLEKQAAEWSEEDSFRTETLISVIKSGGSIRPELRNEYVNWLKSLRPQNTYNPYKAVVESIAEMCKHYDKASNSGLRDFYDNVKVKCKEAQEYDKMFPQAQWKPSELQLGCLSDAIEYYNSSGYPASKLKELLDDLKKLKEGNV